MNLPGKSLARKVLYRTGALGRFHRARHSRALTVLMFHRVLSPADPRWKTCDPEWTVSDVLLREILVFLKEHYHLVSMPDVVAAWREGRELPACPALITFDDGWADNAEHALPLLQEARAPATVFVVAGAVGGREPFWHEAVCRAFRAGRLAGSAGTALVDGVRAAGAPAPPQVQSAAELEALLSGLRALDDAARRTLLERPELGLFDERNMLDAAQLSTLAERGIDIGSHGQTHVPLTESPRPEVELEQSRARLLELLGPRADPATLCFAFPHGRYTPALAERALAAGYPLVFTSDARLNTVPRAPGAARILGRIHVPAGQISPDALHLAPERLALWLFDRQAS